MDPTTVGTIVTFIVKAIQAAIKAGRSMRDAWADSLEEAAAKIRSGAINIDDAVDRARADQAKIDALYGRVE